MSGPREMDENRVIDAIVSDGTPGGALGPMDELTRRRCIEKLVIRSLKEAPNANPLPRFKKRGAGLITAVASAAAVTALFFYLLSGTDGTEDILQKRADADLGVPEIQPRKPHEERDTGARSPSRKTSSSVRTVTDGVRMVVEREAVVEVKRTASKVAVGLESGTVWVDVAPDEKSHVNEVVVHTSRGTVTVKGTVFSVEENDAYTEVTVLEGRVWAAPRKGPPLTIEAGQTGRIGARKVISQSVADQQDAWQMLMEHGVATPRGNKALSVLKALPADNTPPPRPSSEKVSQRVSDPGVRVTAATLLKIARRHRNRRDDDTADQTLATLIRRFPKSEEAAIALVARGRLALDRLNRPQIALKLFNRYLADPAHQTLRAEALYGKARALEATGNRPGTCHVFERFIEQFPNGPLAEEIERTLVDLRSAEACR